MVTKHKQLYTLEHTKKIKFNIHNNITERSLYLGY